MRKLATVLRKSHRKLNLSERTSTSQTDANYARALRWTVVMTVLAHLDPDFGSAFAIEAVNEPNMDANTTPGYGTCMFLANPAAIM